jgi:hypothetical protein
MKAGAVNSGACSARGGKVPYTKRRLTRSERASRLRRAEELHASGVHIVIPKEWRENSCPIDIILGPPDQCLAWNNSTGQTYYSVYLQVCAKQSGLIYPEFDLRVPWDGGILLQTIELIKKKGVGFKPVVNYKQALYFGGQRYWGEEILNPHVEKEERLRLHQIIFGYVLATGTRPIPAEYGGTALVPFDLIARDQFSGDIIQRLEANLTVFRGRQAKCTVPSVGEGLYGGGEPEELGPAERSRLAYRELRKQPKPQFCAPLTHDQCLSLRMEDAAIRRMEKEMEALERKAEARRIQRGRIFIPPFGSAPPQKQPSSIEPNPSVPRRFEVYENVLASYESHKNEAETRDVCD